MRFLSPVLPALAGLMMLSACIDADVTMDFSDGETMQGGVETSFARELFDMMGKSPADACPGGEANLTKKDFTCRTHGETTIAKLLEQGAPQIGQNDFDPAAAARFERVDDNHIRITFDFSELSKNGKKPDPEDLGGMEDMIRAALAGHSFSFHIRAYKITSTTGTLSEDGTEASLVIPVATFLDPEPDLGPAFVTEVQLKQQCTLWIFCD
ncbi:hypothetical protein LPB142_01840 [Rhodobacter xanthinilyticus]|uniref:Lipoprotein n=1 Tax=Rhodobacter xanthinilyticus TaxID=1850250 RepID=A0A1D9M8M2_9RHOB|nr:hypothetical protein [Rhodobacter xanthinilyticus]AOZ68205.1 hypothetical protein LPB142_01840 [Rhodobacter xanthinilyticus]